MNSRHPQSQSPLETAGRGRLSRRSLIAAVALTPTIGMLLAACGDRAGDPAGTTPGTVPGTDLGTTPDMTGATGPITTMPLRVGYPTGGDDAVLRVAYEGGFVPMGVAFVNLPTLLVSGDGRAFTPAPTTMQYPGLLLDPMSVRTISGDGIEALLQLAQAAGLLGDIPDYSSPAEMNIADAPNTVVTITTTEATYVHSAYALGMTGDPAAPAETSPARIALLGFVNSVSALETAAGAGTLGADEILVPTGYRLQAAVYGDESGLAGMDPAPTVVDWPATAGVALADASSCARVTVDAVGTLFSDATDLTYFRDAGVLYTVSVASVLPGDALCAPTP